MNKNLNSAFFNQFKSSCLSLLSYPIKVTLYERKLTKKNLIKLLAKDGYNYNYYLMVVTLDGKANNQFNLHYFTNIYNILSLPLPTPQYLFDSFKRWEEIKQFKLDRRNTNRIKKGLLPVTSISTRIK